jgi:sugar lactone lactonase YvrE
MAGAALTRIRPVARVCAALGCLFLAAFSQPVRSEGFADQYRAAIAAYRAGDPAAFLAAAAAASELRPDSPQAGYLLAAAQASNGRAEEALELLASLERQGLFFEPAREPAFESLQLTEREPGLLARLAAHGEPSGMATETFRLDEDRFVPEGLSWDGKRGRFLLGSIHQRRILAISEDGEASEFVPAGAGGLLSVFGMQVAAATDSLWVATAGLRQSGAIADAQIGRTGILEFDLETGVMRRAFWVPQDDRERLLGDLALAGGGAVLTTDSLTGEVLRLHTGSGRFEVLVGPGRLVSPQGLALTPDAAAVHVADYRGGIFRLDLADGSLAKVAEGGTTHHGVDGLYRHGDWLVAIQNGIRPHRVVALQLNAAGDAVTSFEVLAAALPVFDEPNLGVVVDGRLHFNANSHWPRFDESGLLPDGLSGPLVLSVALP